MAKGVERNSLELGIALQNRDGNSHATISLDGETNLDGGFTLHAGRVFGNDFVDDQAIGGLAFDGVGLRLPLFLPVCRDWAVLARR